MAGTTSADDDLQIDLRELIAGVWRRRVRIVLTTLILCALTYGVLMFVPKQYESSASILVEPRDNIYVRATNDTGVSTGAATDAVVVASQIELIQSADTLLRVIRDLDLTAVEEFSGVSNSPIAVLMRMIRPPSGERDLEQIALARLTQKLTVAQQRDSRVVSIIVSSEDKNLAARIANAIAAAHVNRRAEQSIDDTAEASEWLETEIAKLRTRVSEAESKVAQYRVDNDLFVGPNNTSLLDQQMSDISGQITDAQERRNTAMSRANLIRGLIQAGRPIDSVPDVRESVVIQRLAEDKATLQGELAQLSASLLSNHPDIQAVRAQIAEIDNQINIEGRRVAEALESEAEIETSLIQSLTDDLTRLKLSAGNATTASVQLQELEREAKAQRDLLETYLARYSDAAARTDTNASLPDVRIITLAVPALLPASPKTTLILAAVAFVSLALQIGVILFRELSLTPVKARRAEAEGGAVVEVEETRTTKTVQTEPAIENKPAAGGSKSLVGGLVARLRPGNADKGNEVDAQAVETQAEAKPPMAPPAAANTESAPARLEFGRMSNVISEVISGRTQTLMLLGLDTGADCAGLAEQIIIAALDNGLSVALVDAGSRSISSRPGMSDLSANRAEFGEVVQNTDIEGLSEVCWGTLPRLRSRSEKPAILVEAMADIYEVIIVMAGTVGAGSNLQVFEGLDAGLLLASGGELDETSTRNVMAYAADWGFDNPHLVAAPLKASDVA